MPVNDQTVATLVTALKALVEAARVHNAGIVADTTCAVDFAAALTQAEGALLEVERVS